MSAMTTGIRAWTAALLAAAACGWMPAGAQRPANPPKVAVVFARIPVSDLEGPAPRFPGAQQFQQALAELGWKPGKDIEIVWRSAKGDSRLHDVIMQELVSKPVDVIVVSGNPATLAAMRRTRTIPIVMLAAANPVEAGFVATLAKPGGNVTGIAAENIAGMNGKRLALLKQVAPHVTRVALLVDKTSKAITGNMAPETGLAASQLGIELMPYGVDHHAELEAAVADAVRRGANGMFVDTSLSAAGADQAAFHALARKHRLPTMYSYYNAVASGGLMFYGTRPDEIYRRAASYVHRILSGSRPSEMPVEQPRSLHLVLSLQAAREIGLEIPASVLAQADEVRR